jgi:hypothetical protein
VRWHIERDKALNDNLDDDDLTWDLHDPELAWRVWTLLEATEWKHLPSELLDQDEALMSDLASISARSGIVRQIIEIEKKEQNNGG